MESAISVNFQLMKNITPIMPNRRQQADQRAEQAGGEKTLHRIDVAGDAADQVAGLLFVVIGKRQALDLRIEGAAQFVHDLLPDRGRQRFFGVGAERAQRRDDEHGDGGETENLQRIRARKIQNDIVQPAFVVAWPFSTVSMMIFSGQGCNRSAITSCRESNTR